jgi:hypothetical protein
MIVTLIFWPFVPLILFFLVAWSEIEGDIDSALGMIILLAPIWFFVGLGLGVGVFYFRYLRKRRRGSAHDAKPGRLLTVVDRCLVLFSISVNSFGLFLYRDLFLWPFC